jgi:hypothetical protein
MYPDPERTVIFRQANMRHGQQPSGHVPEHMPRSGEADGSLTLMRQEVGFQILQRFPWHAVVGVAPYDLFAGLHVHQREAKSSYVGGGL